MKICKLVLYSLVVITSKCANSVVDDRDHFKDALDDMERHFNGKNAEFDGEFYNGLVDCFNQHDDDILHKS